MITIQTPINWFGLHFEQKTGIIWFFLTVDAAQCHRMGHGTYSTASVRMTRKQEATACHGALRVHVDTAGRDHGNPHNFMNSVTQEIQYNGNMRNQVLKSAACQGAGPAGHLSARS